MKTKQQQKNKGNEIDNQKAVFDGFFVKVTACFLYFFYGLELIKLISDKSNRRY